MQVLAHPPAESGFQITVRMHSIAGSTKMSKSSRDTVYMRQILELHGVDMTFFYCGFYRFRKIFHNFVFLAKMFHLAKSQNQTFIIFEKHNEKVDFGAILLMKFTKIMKFLSIITLRTVEVRTQDQHQIRIPLAVSPQPVFANPPLENSLIS